AEGLEENAVWAQISTVGLTGTDRLAELSQRLGLRFLDSPVSGTKAPAEQGKLVVLASGDPSARDDAQPFLDAIGAKTVWLGEEPGAASRMKMVLNTWVVALTTATAETLALAEALGIEGSQVLETLEGGPLDSAYLQMKGKMMLERDYPTSFPLAHAGKDARLVLEAARGEGLELAGTQATADQFAQAHEAGHGEADMAAVYEAVTKRG
ncbi:MAG TPA: NAD(P)-dependent oxidoreductase, partial [Solirubrobacteraceae bacterium]